MKLTPEQITACGLDPNELIRGEDEIDAREIAKFFAGNGLSTDQAIELTSYYLARLYWQTAGF